MKSLYLLILLFSLLLSSMGHAADLGDVRSDGGLVMGGKILHVTNLDDDGEGSLRDALKSCGPCVIVFDIAGAIELKSDLNIENDNVTIAGETAPAFGILLHGGTLKIRASDVVISHISVYPGSTDDTEIAGNRDGISTYGRLSAQHHLRNIVIRNASVGWALDENVGLQGLTDSVRLERVLLAQPLRNGGHPKGAHAMNLLLGNTVGRVIVVGSVFAASDYRSPRLTTGNRVSFLNNLIVSPGLRASHLDTSKEILNEGAIDMIGNAYLAGPETKCDRAAITIDNAFMGAIPPTPVYVADTIVKNDFAKKDGCLSLFASPTQEGLAPAPLTRVPSWKLRSAEETLADTLKYAGSHPLARNPIDTRVVNGITGGYLPLIENEDAVGGFPHIQSVTRKAAPPVATSVLETQKDVEAMKQWLCDQDLKLSGLAACSL